MLRQAETIGIFSSSYPLTAIAPKAAENAVHYLEQCGYSVKKANCSEKWIVTGPAPSGKGQKNLTNCFTIRK